MAMLSVQEIVGLHASEVLEQLERIERSPEFIISDRGRRFLRFVVEETVAGRGDRIKAYSIGTQVFERSDSFDPQYDPVVRIEAGRIRRALERYYLVAGKSDPIVTTIPKGGYTPVFTRREDRGGSCSRSLALAIDSPTAHHHADARDARLTAPTLLVVPFSHIGDDTLSKIYALGLTEEVIQQLAKFKELVVIVGASADEAGVAPDGRQSHASVALDYALEGTVQATAQRIRFMTRLMERDTGIVLWSHTFDDDLSVKDLLSVQEATAHSIATTIGQPCGFPFREGLLRFAKRPPDDLDAYSCTLAYYAYRFDFDVDQHASVRAALERVVERFPGYATGWALLSLVYLDEYRFGLNPRRGPPSPIQRALNAANRAVDADPENGRALQAQMLALMFSQEIKCALAIGERALALNPNDVELMSEVGARHVLSGDRPRGIALLEQALALRPTQARYYCAHLAYAAYLNRDLPAALAYVRRATLANNIMSVLISTVIYAEAGLVADAKSTAQRALELRPDLATWLPDQIAKRNLAPEDETYVVESLRKAGLAIRV